MSRHIHAHAKAAFALAGNYVFVPVVPIVSDQLFVTRVRMIAVSNRDLFGVTRGRCTEASCDCQRYTVLALSSVKCEYCDHVPSAHGRISELGKYVYVTVYLL